MSHHFDSPTAIEDGRLNLCDLYVFPARPGFTAVIVTVNPDAGRSSPTTLRPDALYEIVVARHDGTDEDLAFRIQAGEPQINDPTGDARQPIRVLRAEAAASRTGITGDLLGAGHTGQVIALDGGGRAWVGPAADPFWANGGALAQFLLAAQSGDYRPEIFTDQPGNVFAGRNVTAVVLEIADHDLGPGPIAVWARISLYGHAPQRQVSRMGQPMLRPLFFPQPGPDTEALNAGRPDSDRTEHAAALTTTAAAIARLAGVRHPDDQARGLSDAFLPDVLRYQPGRTAAWKPGTGNGRALTDDAFGIALAALTRNPLGANPAPFVPITDLPWLPTPHTEELPPLTELFGLRERRT